MHAGAAHSGPTMNSEPITHAVARNLRRLMASKNLKQSEVAKRAGIGQTTVSLWLNPQARKEGETDTPASGTLARLEALARAVEVAPWELLAPEGAPAFALSEEERAVISALRAARSAPVAITPQAEQEPYKPTRQFEPPAPSPVGRLVIKSATKQRTRGPR